MSNGIDKVGSIQYESRVKGTRGKVGFKIKQQGVSSGSRKQKNVSRLITTRDIQGCVRRSFSSVVHISCQRAFKPIPIR